MAAPSLEHGTPFIGRVAELSVVLDAIGTAGSTARGALVLVHGEPGIGKTRLIIEATEAAVEHSTAVAVGGCEPAATGVPFHVFREVLINLASQDGVGTVFKQVLEKEPEVLRIAPELAHGDTHVDASRRINPLAEPFRLFEGVASLLREVADASSGGLLVCIEDLHWADESSLAVLRHLARRLEQSRVTLLVTYRDVDAANEVTVAETIGALLRATTTRSLALGSWDREELREYLAAVVRPFPPPAVTDAVLARTEGNPFFVRGLVQELQRDGRLLNESGAWNTNLQFEEGELPGDARILTAQVLRHASVACREALLVAAIQGHGFEFSLLPELSGLSQSVLVSALDEATRLGLIGPDAQDMQFTHELVRQAVLSSVSAPRRQQLHLRTAQAMQATGGYSSARIVLHLHLAGPLADAKETCEIAIVAGKDALAALAYDEAARVFDMAVRANERSTAGVDAAARLRALRGEALFYLARHREATPDFEFAAKVLPPEERVDVLVPLALASIWSERMDAARKAVAEAEVLAAELGRSDLNPAIEAMKAYCETNEGQLPDANQRFREATESAAYHEPGAHSKLLSQFPLNLYWTGQFVESIERAQAGVKAARELNDRSELSSLLPALGLSLSAVGRYREAIEAFAEAQQVARELNNEIHVLAAFTKTVGFRIDTYSYEDAKAISLQVYGPAGSIDNYPYVAISTGIDLILIAARTRTPEDGDKVLANILGRIDTEHGRHGFLWRMRIAVARAELELAKGHSEAAIELAEEGLMRSRQSGRIKYEALALEARGNALIELGRRNEGIANLREAIEVARPTGDPAMFLRAATLLLAVDFDGDILAEAEAAAQRIKSNLPDEMLAPFEASEAVRLISGVRAGVSVPASSENGPAGLSARELEVLLLLADGKSDRGDCRIPRAQRSYG